MSAVPKTAMVLAAGLGTRMRPLTDDRPKALVEVGGKALIDHMLDRLAEAGVERVVVNLHAFADRLIAHLKARTDGIGIAISDERAHPRPLETGGGVKFARALLPETPILVANIDSVWIEDGEPPASAIQRLCEGYDPARMAARLMLARMERTSGFDGAGDFKMEADGALVPAASPASPPRRLTTWGPHPRSAPGFCFAPDRVRLLSTQRALLGRLGGGGSAAWHGNGRRLDARRRSRSGEGGGGDVEADQRLKFPLPLIPAKAGTQDGRGTEVG